MSYKKIKLHKFAELIQMYFQLSVSQLSFLVTVLRMQCLANTTKHFFHSDWSSIIFFHLLPLREQKLHSSKQGYFSIKEFKVKQEPHLQIAQDCPIT